MKGKRYFLCVTAVALGLLCLFTACSKKQGDKDEYTPTSSLEMTDSEAAALGEKVRVILYFTDSKGENLFAESQLAEFTPKDRRTENMAKQICEMLAAGPANQDTYVNTLPADSTVRSVKMDKGIATVDFNEAFLSNLSTDPAKLNLMVCAIANTLTELKKLIRSSSLLTVRHRGSWNADLNLKRLPEIWRLFLHRLPLHRPTIQKRLLQM